MAAPTYVGATNPATDAAGDWTYAGGIPEAVEGDFVVLQILQDGATSAAVALSTVGNFYENVAGTDSALTSLGSFAVGSATAAFQHLWLGRVANTAGDTTITGTNSTSEDLYIRVYAFTGVAGGTTLATVIENGTAGNVSNGAGTSDTVADTGVTTLGADRLALNFVAVNDDNTLDAFTGTSGGTWAEAVAEYAESSGTDGAIGLQIATIASAGTINGGTDTMAASDAWGVVGFALIGTTAAGPAASLVIPHHGYPTAPTRYRI